MVPQDAIGAPLGHPGPSLSCPGQRPDTVEDGRAPRSPQDWLTWAVGATGQLSGASARRRELGPRRVAGAAEKGGSVTREQVAKTSDVH